MTILYIFILNGNPYTWYDHIFILNQSPGLNMLPQTNTGQAEAGCCGLLAYQQLSHGGRNNMAAILQTTF